MHIKKFILFFLFSFTLLSAYEVSVCCIFRDDAKYLPEWIEFHQKQGVEHFYLYNNLSSDEPRTYLDHYIQKDLVTLIDWPYESLGGQDWIEIQCEAYMHCANNYKKKTRWLAFLDTDEFLFCVDGTTLPKFLKPFRKYRAVGVNWVMYGTSNVTIPENGKLTDCLVYRSEISYPDNIHVKTIAQPKYIERIDCPHYVILKNGEFEVTENEEAFCGPFSPTISVNKIRINHYWSRDLDFFYNVKLPRREKWYGDREGHILMESQLNAVYDPVLRNSF